jgi:putative Mn2+ efflux pump MntP
LDFIDIVSISFGLAMDAFTVSMAASGTGQISNGRAIFRLSFHFGLFQFMMPVIGWFTGSSLAPIISAYDHWIAFILLQFVALHMIISSQKSVELRDKNDPSRGIHLIILSFVTSIDALAVGFSLAMIQINIWYPSVIIGLITASMALIGTVIGNYTHQKLGKTTAIIGGIILSVIGFRILLSQL